MARVLSTGFVRANAYDIKVRKVLFAQAKALVSNDEILRAAAELNQKIFEELQNKGAEKRDVIRVRVEYEIRDGRIEWKYDTLDIDIYKESEAVGSKLSSILQEVEEKNELLKKLVEKLKELSENVRRITYEIDNTLKTIEEEAR